MSLIISVKDAYRQAVEAASGGKNTVMYDDKGNPSIMVAIPRFNLSDVIDGAPNTPPPAFIVNGVIKDVIWISKYQNVVHDSRAYSLPGLDPRTSITFDQAKAACAAKGAGWHLMTNAEWAAIALWSKKNGTVPRGNNNFGSDHAQSHEKIVAATKGADERTNRGKTGTGVVTWSHDGTVDGVYDLNGNVWEWVDGFKINNSRITIMTNNDYNAAESAWTLSSYYDNRDGLVISGSNTEKGEMSKAFSNISPAPNYTIPDVLKHLAIAPHDATVIDDVYYVNLTGERMAIRGGGWSNQSAAGVFALDLRTLRTGSLPSIGFRSAYIL